LGYDIPVFALGLIFGAGLLFVGLGIGIWLGRKSVWHSGGIAAGDRRWRQLLEAWSQETDGVANVVSGCRDALDRMEDQCREAHRRQGNEPQESGESLLTEMIQTNEQVRLRLEKAEEALQQQAQDISSYVSEARTDALTGLPNRRALDSEMSRRLNECRREDTHLSLVIIDIDHFKHLNDRYGHLAGDSVLSRVGQVLRQAVEPPDMATRLGGEEFVIVLPGKDAVAAGRSAEHIRQAIQRAEYTFERQRLQVTVSCGVAKAHPGEIASAVLKRADEALYASKAAGRNCGHLHDGRQCIPLTRRESGELVTPTRIASGKVNLLENHDFRQVCQDVRSRLLSVVEREKN
jgi:diguanylate cyclase